VGGVNCGDTARGAGDVLSKGFLDRLTDRDGVCVLYTHPGKPCGLPATFDAAAVAGLRRLADMFRAGRILVTTTRRLLGFCRALREGWWTACRRNGHVTIDFRVNVEAARGRRGLPPDDLDGLTFYVPEPESARVTVNGHEVAGILRNPPDHTGRPSVSLPWPRLEFPDL
jgi:hypothetical protein